MIEPRSFSITSVTILKGCSDRVKKNLKAGIYRFNTWDVGNNQFYQDFFGQNISIQAIVGKNGSGKSSLMDLIIRLTNNFGYMVFHHKKVNENTLPICYVRDVVADLYFMVNDTKGCILCRNESLAYCFGDMRYRFGPFIPEFEDFLDGNNPNDETILTLSQDFFYSLAINYSIHAFNEDCYRRDSITHAESEQFYPWIKSIFHKNDGYRIPITLNPYKDNGTLNMERENHLNQSRLISILKYSEKNNLQFIENYRLSHIDYFINSDSLMEKFSAEDLTVEVDIKSYYEDKNMRLNTVMESFKLALASEKSYAYCIINAYGYSYDSEQDDYLRLFGYLYLVYKVLNIAGTYPTFSDYDDFGNMRLCFEQSTGDTKGVWEPFELADLVDDLKKNTSHITLKLRQVQCFLNHYHSREIQRHMLESPFDYETYLATLEIQGVEYNNLDSIMETLPPAFFSPDIYFDKYNKDGNKLNVRPILISDMSSGELQFVHIMSTIVYHAKNLLTITEKERVKYRCINLLMDEIELCFHPDYQRKFVTNIIGTLSRMHLTNKCGFSILLSTHSPFILSDIPQANILYLSEGEDVSSQIEVNPFGANVNDVLRQSFFLEDGFMGTFAKERILSLMEYLKKTDIQDSAWTMEKAEKVIDEIGDPLIKEQLSNCYLQKRYPHDKNGQRQWLMRKLDELNQ